MYALRARILAFARANGTMPRDLASLPSVAAYSNEIADGWGQPIQLSIVEDRYVILKSFGADKRSGGREEGADIEGRFLLKKADGKWGEISDDWLDVPR
jgi:hypothetical protein